MADGVNRVWMSVDLGSYTVGKKVSVFAGGDSPDEVHHRLSGLLGAHVVDELLGKIVEASADSFVNAVTNLNQGGMTGGGGAPAPKADGPVCQHGPRVYKNGQSAKGPWAAWMCSQPKGSPGACSPEWVK
jgi:hypothetical protein